MSEDHSLFQNISDYIRLSKDSVDLLKSAVGLLPKGEESERAARQIDETENALRITEVQLAKSLGYNLCQCTFPPEIMLSAGRHPQRGIEIFKCGKCGKQEPSEQYFNALDRNDAAIARGGGAEYF